MSLPDPELPELHQSVLDADTVRQLVSDVSSLTEILEVIPKGTSDKYVADPGSASTMNIELGRDLLLAGEIRGLQIRYRHEGAQWWDTLLSTPEGFKIVRIRHDFDHIQQEI